MGTTSRSFVVTTFVMIAMMLRIGGKTVAGVTRIGGQEKHPTHPALKMSRKERRRR